MQFCFLIFQNIGLFPYAVLRLRLFGHISGLIPLVREKTCFLIVKITLWLKSIYTGVYTHALSQ